MTAAQVRSPVESKVWAGTAGSGVGAALSAFILWALGVCFWGAVGNAAHATDAIAAVPFPVSALVGLSVTGAVTFGAAYLAKHTPRLIEGAESDAAAYQPAHADAGLSVLGADNPPSPDPNAPYMGGGNSA